MPKFESATRHGYCSRESGESKENSKRKSLKFKNYEASTSNTVTDLGNGHLTESINKKFAHGLARAGYKAIYTRWYYPRLIIARPTSC